MISNTGWLWCAAACAMVACTARRAAGAADAIPIRLTTQNMHDMTLKEMPGGVYQIQTTGTDPYVFTEPLPHPPDPDQQSVLAFDFFSTTGTDQMQVFLIPPLSEENSVKAAGLSHSEGWSSYSVDLQEALLRLGSPVSSLRLDFGNFPGKDIQIRSLSIRPPTPQEKALAAGKVARLESDHRLDVFLRRYLDTTYPCQVTRVTVDSKHVRIEGHVSGEKAGLRLAAIPLWADLNQPGAIVPIKPIHPDSAGRFRLVVDRVQGKRDCLLTRWAVVHQVGDQVELLSHAHYPDSVKTRWDLPLQRPLTKKGLGGFHLCPYVSDLDDLGISAVTVNVVLNSLMSTTPGPGMSPFNYAGRTWYTNDDAVKSLDQTLLQASKRHIVVSAILLVGQPGNAPAGSFTRLLAYPYADPSGIFAMPDVSSQSGLDAYGAVLDFMAQRYSRPDERYGRIQNYIMHNEVNSGWVWTNAGPKTDVLYMDLYQKSLRAAYLIARQYNPHLKVFVSLDHFWAMKMDQHNYAGRDLLEWLLHYCGAEGDFDWALAYHPYPQDLSNPRVWEDKQVNFTFDTPMITFKNIEVLDAWARQPDVLYRGKTPRTIELTEQGLNSPNYGDEALRDQAAGMAYAWNKIKHLSTIQVFDYHNWIDNRGEGGLRIGLRKFPDDKTDPGGKKPIWYVYQALGTPQEAAVTAPYKTVVGVKDWNDVEYHGAIR